MKLEKAAAAQAKEKQDSAQKRKDAVVHAAKSTGDVVVKSFMIRNGGFLDEKFDPRNLQRAVNDWRQGQ
eukprot:16829-Rhodomonas_salina.1